jgi:hypothetical protein
MSNEAHLVGRDCIENADLVGAPEVIKLWRERREQKFLLLIDAESEKHAILIPSVAQLRITLDTIRNYGPLLVIASGEQATAAMKEMQPNGGEKGPIAEALH